MAMRPIHPKSLFSLFVCVYVCRGGSEQFIEESQRSIWDALMVVKRCMDTHEVVAGGGAIEMELSRHLKEHAKTISGKSQLLIGAYAKAFEIVPRQLSDNAGFDSTDILNQLRTTHADSSDKKHMYFGVDVNGDGQSASREGVWGVPISPYFKTQNAFPIFIFSLCYFVEPWQLKNKFNENTEMKTKNKSKKKTRSKIQNRKNFSNITLKIY